MSVHLYYYRSSLNLNCIFGSEMYHEWTIELKAMADRIISMRQQLFDALRTRGKWVSLLFSTFELAPKSKLCLLLSNII